ncbi:hypothetical protein PL81_16905 [Streptomyces sp. RSD-27]|nr:hypothetical protein PL81_16905 [Streptomyces sp. RSD-27]
MTSDDDYTPEHPEWDTVPPRRTGTAAKARYPALKQSSPATEPNMPFGMRRKIQRVLLTHDLREAEFRWGKLLIRVRVDPPEYLEGTEDDDTLRRRVVAFGEWDVPNYFPDPPEVPGGWALLSTPAKVRFGPHQVVTVQDVKAPEFSDAVWTLVGAVVDTVQHAIPGIVSELGVEAQK